MNGKVDEGWNLFEQTYSSMAKELASGEDTGNEFAQRVSSIATLYRSKKKESVEAILQNAEEVLAAKLENETANTNDLRAYTSFMSSLVSGNMYSDPEQSMKYLTTLSNAMDRFAGSKKDLDTATMQGFRQGLKGLEARVGDSIARLRLIGTEAPEFNAQDFVGMEPSTLADLKGKVVLLDFWAIWCGPCIATFPHLRDWHEKFTEQGFVILGMTQNYSYEWDSDKSRPVKATDVSNEQELVMLKSFREHHKLGHGFVLTAKEASYSKQLRVSGIPQAVLIDKQGKVRMIKVGSGESNAIDLENEIKKLLAE